jgi:hypothetical protein
MQRITLTELREKYNGVLPPGFGLRGEDDPPTATTPPSRACPVVNPGRGARAKGSRRPNPVVRRLLGYRKFFAALPSQEPKLSPGAVAVWCLLWTNADRRGRARTSERRLSDRLGMARDTSRARLVELAEAGFIRLVRQGKHGRRATVYHVRATPKRSTG